MSNLPKSLTNKAKRFFDLSDPQKLKFLQEAYVERGLSWAIIAKHTGGHANTLRRIGKKLGVKSRSKADAQKKALESGRHEHPTKDKGHSESSKILMSERMAKVWDNLSPEEYEERCNISREIWNAMSPAEQEELRKKARDAVRETAKTGSKLERYLMEELIDNGYRVEFHKEYHLKNERLQIDLFLPTLKVALEIDGPSHFSPIWGKDTLDRNLKADAQKDGLLLGLGFCVIRVRQKKTLSQKYQRDLLKSLLEALKKIEARFPTKADRYITLGDD